MSKASTTIRKRSVMIAGHSTSVSMEDAFWQALKRLARDDGKSLNALISDIDITREKENRNLSSALRVYVLERLEKLAR